MSAAAECEPARRNSLRNRWPRNRSDPYAPWEPATFTPTRTRAQGYRLSGRLISVSNLVVCRTKNSRLIPPPYEFANIRDWKWKNGEKAKGIKLVRVIKDEISFYILSFISIDSNGIFDIKWSMNDENDVSHVLILIIWSKFT